MEVVWFFLLGGQRTTYIRRRRFSRSNDQIGASEYDLYHVFEMEVFSKK